jgi:hypothetical protein
MRTVVQGVAGNAGVFFFDARWPPAVLEPLSSNSPSITLFSLEAALRMLRRRRVIFRRPRKPVS